MTKPRSIPKYQVIRDELKAWIASGALSHGDKLPVEAELAGKFQVSRQTVRQAIGELVQLGILERKQGSGTYYVEPTSRPSAKARSGIVGVITTYISDYIFPDIIRGIVDRLGVDNYSPLLYSTQNDLAAERKALEDVLTKEIDAVIVEATKGAFPNTNLDLYAKLEERGIPVVMLHARYLGLHVPLVEVDDAHGANLAVSHLIENGHTRIGGIIKLDDLQGLRRMEGFTDALGQQSIPFRAQWMSFYTTEEQQVVTAQFASALARLRPEQRPTAVFCYNDGIAVSLLKDLEAVGLSAPAHLSIVSFDDALVARHSHPPLTTIAHPKYNMGFRVAELVVASLQGNIPGQLVHTFTPELIVRSSTTRLNKQLAQ